MFDVIGWISLIFFIIAGSLIAACYPFVWHRIFQRPEPWTPQFARMAEAWPWPSIIFVALQVLAAIAINIWGNTWERIFGLIGVGFYAWFIPHIIQYVIDHHGDNPPYTGIRGLLFNRKEVKYG
jgi:hypothetical protein